MTHNHTPHIRTEKLTAIIGGRTLFTDLNLTIKTATRLAIVGENGRGKTTLLHLLAGETEPHSGTITRAGTSALVAQTLETPAHNTVGDLIEHALSETHAALRRFDAATEALKHDTPEAAAEYAQALEEVVALDAWDVERKIQMALEGLGACPDRTKVLNTLFVGQRYRVCLAVLLASSTDILLLDEPTNHLDDAALGFLATALKNRSGGVALVSHDRQLLHDVADTFLDLDPTMDSIPRTHGGGYDNWRAAKHKERITWKQQYEHHIEEKQRLEQAVQAARARLTTGWPPAKGTNRYQRASKTDNQLHTLDRQVRALAQLDIPVPKPPQELAFPQPTITRGAAIVHATDIGVAGRLAPTNINISTGDKLLITGPNGAGKSTLLAILAQQLSPTTGTLTFYTGRTIAYLAQEVPRWRPGTTSIVAYQHHMVSRGVHNPPSLASLGLLDDVTTHVDKLSQGQQRRLHLAMCIAERPDLLILDEPTNHLFMTLVDELTQALKVTASAVVVATDDRAMIAELADWSLQRCD